MDKNNDLAVGVKCICGRVTKAALAVRVVREDAKKAQVQILQNLLEEVNSATQWTDLSNEFNSELPPMIRVEDLKSLITKKLDINIK